MKNKILSYISSSDYKRQMYQELILSLSISKEMTGLFQTSLKELVDEGVLWQHKKKYDLVENYGIYKGKIQVKQQGFGFVSIPDMDDVFIPRTNINGAFNNDIVLVKINHASTQDMKSEGDVIRIIERGKNVIIGTFKKNPHLNIIVNDNINDKFDCLVKDEDSLGAITDHKVKAIITEYGENYVYCQVVKILGYINDPGIDILSVCNKYDLETKFSDDVYNSAADIKDYITDDEIENRIDRRNETIVTIDGPDAKDLDDAVSVKLLDNGNYLLGVYIADVSYYVKRDSVLDKEAYLRGTSVYLVDRVIPMLPERLCNGICSLNPNVDRLVIACEMEIDRFGNVVNHQIFPGVINSTARMTYQAVNEILDGYKPTMDKYNSLVDFFYKMDELSTILEDARYARGSINFETKEPKIKVDDNGYPLDIYFKPRGISEGIIEEFMLIANETVAKHINLMALPFIYRVHEYPDEKKIKTVLSVIANMGYKARFLNKQVTPKDCQNLLSSLEGKPGYEGISVLMLRAMMKAKYSKECLGHYGLALKYYTHFTSPIRRYPDTLVHRMLREFLFENKVDQENIDYWTKMLPVFAKYTSECEKTAVDCERECFSMKAAEYMESHIGEDFNGVVSSLTKFGMFVELSNGVEGLVHISAILNDYYEYDERRMILIGMRKHNYFQLGDRIVVKVVNASKISKTIDFKIVNVIDVHKEEKKKKKGDRRYENHRSKQKGKF